MDLSDDQLRAFVAVVRHGGFSRAGEALLRSQSAVSVQVARLEQAVGARLLHRTTRRIALTEAGEVLLRYADRIERLRAQALHELADLSGLARGRLLLSASDTIGCYLLPGVLQAFRARHPAVEIALRNATSPRTTQAVLDHAVDLGIVTLGPPRPGLAARPLFPRQDVLICAPNHRLVRRRRVRLKDLEREPFLLLDPFCASRRILDDVCAAARVTLRIHTELSSIEVIKRFVRTEAGLSIVPAMAIREELAAGTLASVRVADFEERPPARMGVIHREDRYLSIAARRFLEELETAFAGPAHRGETR